MAVKELIDSQGLSLSYQVPGAQTWTELEDVTDSPLASSKRETDDITTVKDTHKETTAAGVISSDTLQYEVLQISGSAQQKELKEHFENGTMLKWKLVLPDSVQTTYTWNGTLTEYSPVRAANKKNRLKISIEPSGKVEMTETP